MPARLQNDSVVNLTRIFAAQMSRKQLGFEETFKGYDGVDDKECHLENEADNEQSTLDVSTMRKFAEYTLAQGCLGLPRIDSSPSLSS